MKALKKQSEFHSVYKCMECSSVYIAEIVQIGWRNTWYTITHLWNENDNKWRWSGLMREKKRIWTWCLFCICIFDDVCHLCLFFISSDQLGTNILLFFCCWCLSILLFFLLFCSTWLEISNRETKMELMCVNVNVRG